MFQSIVRDLVFAFHQHTQLVDLATQRERLQFSELSPYALLFILASQQIVNRRKTTCDYKESTTDKRKYERIKHHQTSGNKRRYQMQKIRIYGKGMIFLIKIQYKTTEQEQKVSLKPRKSSNRHEILLQELAEDDGKGISKKMHYDTKNIELK